VQVDFTVPHLWLPRNTCDRFESAFGLTYDNNTDLYLISDQNHTRMLRKNPSVTIGFGASSNPAERVNIILPYSAFDLQASHPIYSKETNYFPVRRAANESQYTLGRTLLQEAYIVVDYERRNFSIHQARFPQSNNPKQITAILGLELMGSSNSTTTPHPPRRTPQKNAIIGITIGIVAFAVLLAGITTLLYQPRRRNREFIKGGTKWAMHFAHTMARRKPSSWKGWTKHHTRCKNPRHANSIQEVWLNWVVPFQKVGPSRKSAGKRTSCQQGDSIFADLVGDWGVCLESPP
jgi:hypothetical protein